MLVWMVGLSVYWALIHFAVVPTVSYFKVSVLILAVSAVFVASVPVEFVYARRKLFSRAQQPNLKPAYLLFPSWVAIVVCFRVFDWLDLRKRAAPRV